MINYINENSDLKGKTVLLRLDLNVPIKDGQVTDPYRIEKSIGTIDLLRSLGAKTIVVSHCEGNESTTLEPMWKYLNGYFPVEFSPTYFTPEAIGKITEMKERSVLLFENLRINPGEKENDPEFSKKLAQMAEIFVNDAFAVCHRKHASVVGVPQFLPHFGGPLLKEEIENLSEVFKNPKKPFVFILGGAKFDTKMPLINKYLELADKVFVAGALSNNVYKEQGFEIGTSLMTEGDFGVAEMLKNPKFSVPVDVTVRNESGEVRFCKPNEVKPGEKIVDSGPETIKQLQSLLDGAKMVVWNGPLGYYEDGFSDKTESLAEIISEMKEKGCETIIGGGDTLASIKKLGLEDKFSFVSTGGGAMLDFLANESLPGIEVLEK